MAYGEHIDEYKSALQLLLALRDAIAAHARLLGKGIVHRDISNKNILLGIKSKDLADGYRGILTDLGLALNFVKCGPDLTKDTLAGNHFFQSCMTLEYLTSSAIGPAPAHDYLDDLEHFFYVLCRMFFLKLPNGQDRNLADRARNIVNGWESEDADHALPPKSILFDHKRAHSSFAAALVGETWGQECQTLFEEYTAWIRTTQEYKAVLRPKPPNSFDVPEEQKRFGPQSTPDVVPKSPFAPLYEHSRKHYRDVVGYFNKAIGDLMRTSPPPMEAYEPDIPEPDLTSIAKRLRERKRPAEVNSVPANAPSGSRQDDRPKRSRGGLRSQQ